MENKVKKVKTFIGLQCDNVFETENGLKGPNNKKHDGIKSRNQTDDYERLAENAMK